MAITGGPRVWIACKILDAGTSTAALGAQPVTINGEVGSAAGVGLTIGTGTADAINVLVYNKLTFVANTTQDINLFASADALGTKSMTKCHGFIYEHQGAAEATGSVAIAKAGSTAFEGGAIDSTTGFPLKPNSTVAQTNRNIAGWTVSNSVKLITHDPGANVQTIKAAHWGE